MPSNRAEQTHRRKPIYSSMIALIVPVLACVAFYVLVSWPKEYVWDDIYLIRDNKILSNKKESSVVEAVVSFFSHPWAFGTSSQLGLFKNRSYWRPLTMSSYLIDSMISHSPSTYRLGNVVLHLCTISLVVFFALGLGMTSWVAMLCGLFFGLHPLTVEAVCVAAYRTTILQAVFSLLTANIWIRTSKSIYRGGLGVAGVALATLSKETGILLPVLLVLLDVAKQRFRGEKLEKAVIYLPMVAVAAFLLAVRATIVLPATGYVAAVFPFTTRVIWGMKLLFFYGLQIFFPLSLSAHYDLSILPPPSGILDLYLWFGLALVCFLVFALFRFVRYRSTGWAMLLCAVLYLAPFLQFVPLRVVAADRFAYMPLIFIIVATAFALCKTCKITEKMFVKFADSMSRKKLATALSIIMLLVFGCMSYRSYRRAVQWRSNYSILLDDVKNQPNSFSTNYDLARYLLKSGKCAESRLYAAKAARLWPGFKPAKQLLQKIDRRCQ